MINTLDRVINQLLGIIYIDKKDPSIIRISFDQALMILARNEIYVPPKVYEETFKKVIEERLVGKIQANDVAKWAIAQALLNTALTIALTKEDLLKLRLRDNDVTSFEKNG